MPFYLESVACPAWGFYTKNKHSSTWPLLTRDGRWGLGLSRRNVSLGGGGSGGPWPAPQDGQAAPAWSPPNQKMEERRANLQTLPGSQALRGGHQAGAVLARRLIRLQEGEGSDPRVSQATE